MSNKQKLLARFMRKDKTLTVADLDTFMRHCGCIKSSSGRGSGLRYVHENTKSVLTFDGPHPGKELKYFHLRKVLEFLQRIEGTL